MPFSSQKVLAYSTVRSWLPSSIRMMRVGLRVWRASAARHSGMLLSSLKAGITTSTVASRQSSAGLGTVLSGPWIRPTMLSTVFGLRMK